MLQGKTIGFIGAGNMGEALIGGLLESDLASPGGIWCADVRAGRLRDLEQRYGVRGAGDNRHVVEQSDIVVLAVKPQILSQVMRETAPSLDRSKLLISIAAGVPLATIMADCREPLRLIRAMPNICAAVKASATAIVPGDLASEADIAMAKAIFNAVGRCIVLPNEGLLDAVTGLSGSGPAYGFIIIDALADAGVKMGLGREEALLLAAQTLLGAATMLLETHEHPGRLKDRVTSPGGTTIAGLHVLEKGGLRGVMMDAVEAATARSRQLGALAPQGKATGSA